MSLADLSTAQLRQVLSLMEKRESIQTEITKVEAQIAAIEKTKSRVSASPVSGTKAKPARARKPAKGHTLTDSILEILESAGVNGASVKDIAGQLKTTTRNVFVWYATRGKKIDRISRVKPGVYGLKAVK